MPLQEDYRNKKDIYWEWRRVLNTRANGVSSIFENFQYVVEVNPARFLDKIKVWQPCVEAKRIFWPCRNVDTACVWTYLRVILDPQTEKLVVDEINGQDRVFVGTNSQQDVVEISLKWT